MFTAHEFRLQIHLNFKPLGLIIHRHGFQRAWLPCLVPLLTYSWTCLLSDSFQGSLSWSPGLHAVLLLFGILRAPWLAALISNLCFSDLDSTRNPLPCFLVFAHWRNLSSKESACEGDWKLVPKSLFTRLPSVDSWSPWSWEDPRNVFLLLVLKRMVEPLLFLSSQGFLKLWILRHFVTWEKRDEQSADLVLGA